MFEPTDAPTDVPRASATAVAAILSLALAQGAAVVLRGGRPTWALYTVAGAVLVAALVGVWSRIERPADEWIALAVSAAFLLHVALRPTIHAHGYTVAAIGTLAFVSCVAGSRAWPRAQGVLLVCLIGIAAVQALLGLAQSSGARPTREIFSATGTFTNRNHFAHFLAIAAMIGVPLVLNELVSKRREPGSRRPSSFLAWTGCIAVGTIALGILASLSRGALLALLGGLAWIGLITVLRGRSAGAGIAVLPAALVLAALVTWGISRTGSSWEDRFALIEENVRPEIFSNTLELIAEHPWLGVGPGMFRWAFRPFQTADLEHWYTHVHNDYLELAVEWGVPLAVLFWAAVVTLWWRSSRRALATSDLDALGGTLAIAGALVVVLLHGLVDFNLHIPANLIAIAIVCGLGWSGTRARRPRMFARPASIALLAAFTLIAVAAGGRIASRGLAISMMQRAASVEELERALAWDATNPEIHLRLGSVHRDFAGLRDLDRARGHLEHALALNPLNWRYWQELAALEERAGDIAAAREAFQHAIALNPRDGSYRWRLANLLLRSGDEETLLDELGPALELDDGLYAPAWLLLRKLGASAREIDDVWPRHDGARSWLVRQAATLPVDAGPELFDLLTTEWERLVSSRTPLEIGDGAGIVRALLIRNRAHDASAYWLRLTRAHGVVDAAFTAGETAVWNGSFDRPLERVGLGWWVPPRSGVEVERVVGDDGDAHLRLTLDGLAEPATIGPRQTVVVAPGLYRVSYRLDAGELRGGAISVRLWDRRVGAVVPAEASATASAGWTIHVELIDIAPVTAAAEPRALELRLAAEPALGRHLRGISRIDDVVIAAVAGGVS